MATSTSSIHNKILIVFLINLVFTVIEFVGGLWTQSLAIQSDAIHDLGDCLILGFAYFLERVSLKKPTQVHTYGFRRLSILSTVLIAIILILGCTYIIFSAWYRFQSPLQPYTVGMFYIAIIGIAFNGYAAFKLFYQKDSSHSHHHGHHHNHAHHSSQSQNHHQRVLYFHMLEDVLGWVAILIGAIIMHFFDVPRLDVLLSVIIALIIIYNAINSLRPVYRILLQSTPYGINSESLKSDLIGLAGITAIHDFHFWSLDGNTHVLTMHVVAAESSTLLDILRIKSDIRNFLKSYPNIHATIEVELQGKENCELEDCV